LAATIRARLGNGTVDGPALPGFRRFSFAHEGRKRYVFRTGHGAGVLLLHELPGMVPECVDLGRRLADAGFTVFLPLMFGEAGKRHHLPPLCVTREFNLWRSGRTSPIVGWLRALSRHIHDLGDSGPRLGVIGMCLTGSFALTMMLDDWVTAPVVSQPSLPLAPSFIPSKRRGALDVSDADLSAAVAAAEQRDIQVKGFRFMGDVICPRERFETLRAHFGARFSPHEVPGGKHSVFTLHYMDMPAEDRQHAWSALLTFLHAQLG
jgi:dienelactone hydrolase